MKIDDMTIGQVNQILALFGGQPRQQCANPMIGKYVVVRTYSAGVHVGVLLRRDGRDVTLSETRRVHSWKGAKTLSEIAIAGVGVGSNLSAAAPANDLRAECEAEAKALVEEMSK